MRKFRKPLLFALAPVPFAALGGYLAAAMQVAAMEPAVLDEAVHQVGSREALLAISALQPVVYTLFCGFFGYILAQKLGLMRPFGFEKSKLLVTFAFSLAGGAVFSLDAWTFAKVIPEVAASYETAGSFDAVTWGASVLYGGIVEETMIRLFFMSLIAFIAWKLFFRKEETVPAGVLIAANIVAALAFAASHLPSTLVLFGTLTPMILFRCFLLNGAFGLVFGRLYRKYGIQYAMLSHALFHIVSRTIWLILL